VTSVGNVRSSRSRPSISSRRSVPRRSRRSVPRRSKSTQPRSSRVGRREVAGGRPPQDVRTPCHTPTRESHVCLHSWDCVRSGVRGSYKMTGGGILRRRKFVARRAWVRSNTPWGRGGGRTERDGRQGMHLSSIPLVRPLSSAL
jgi:hypothetical protein